MAVKATNWRTIRNACLALSAGAGAAAAIFVMFGPGGVWPAAGAAVVLALLGWIAESRRADRLPTQPPATETSPAAHLSEIVREVFEALPDPLMLLDGSGRALFANAAMRAIVGGEFERKPVSTLLRMPAVLSAVEQTARTGVASSVEFAVRVPVERYYQAYVANTAAPPHWITLLLHDMTAVKRAEQARADFVANASHELRTPLAAVAGFIDTLRGHARDDPAAREKFLEIMALEAGRMRRLIDDLLSLNRIELNEHVPPSGRTDMAAVARDAAAALAPLAQAERISVAVESPPDLPPVTGERDELIQVLQNLIHNAIKYGKPGGHVWVRLGTAASRQGPEVVAAVKDDGEGIPHDAVPRLTERFYRVDVKRSREKGGTGLGLAIVKHIVNRHRGRLQIESEPGAGSTFTVFLPASPVAAPSPVAVTEVL